MKKCIGFLMVLMAAFHIGASGFDVKKLAEVGSYVPESENYIHIGGGFFSFFDRQKGNIRLTDESSGSIRFILSGMGWESRFHYLPEGEIVLETGDGSVRSFTMQRLEYIPDPDGDGSLYRLTAADQGFHMVILCRSDYLGGSKSAVLEGSILITDNGSDYSETIFSFSLIGRDEHMAERHLNRVITAVSDFSGMRL